MSGRVTEADILVLPLDVVKFDTHKEHVRTVVGHFKQVNNSIILKLLFKSVARVQATSLLLSLVSVVRCLEIHINERKTRKSMKLEWSPNNPNDFKIGTLVFYYLKCSAKEPLSNAGCLDVTLLTIRLGTIV